MEVKQMSFTIDQFPMPPSTNKLYAWVNGRMVKTRDYNEFERMAYKWITLNPTQLIGVRQFLKDFSEKHVIDVSTDFYFEKKRIVCQNGRPKRNDTSNRIKALHDVLSSIILGVDDCYFWSGVFNKFPLREGEVDEHVKITFKLRMLDEAAGA